MLKSTLPGVLSVPVPIKKIPEIIKIKKSIDILGIREANTNLLKKEKSI